jgi:hypothetical protein
MIPVLEIVTILCIVRPFLWVWRVLCYQHVDNLCTVAGNSVTFGVLSFTCWEGAALPGKEAMLTKADVARLSALAGDDFDYAAVRGSDRPSTSYNGGNPRMGLRTYLHAQQGGICVECGKPVALDVAETAHVVSRGPKVKGFMPGNLMALHPACNTAQKDRGPIVDPDTLARPDLVVMSWPVPKASGFYTYARKA